MRDFLKIQNTWRKHYAIWSILPRKVSGIWERYFCPWSCAFRGQSGEPSCSRVIFVQHLACFKGGSFSSAKPVPTLCTSGSDKSRGCRPTALLPKRHPLTLNQRDEGEAGQPTMLRRIAPPVLHSFLGKLTLFPRPSLVSLMTLAYPRLQARLIH